MDTLFYSLFYDQLELHIPDPACEQALNALQPYFEQVDATMGQEFGDQMRKAEFDLSQTECLSYFTRGFQLAVKLLLAP